MSTPTPVPTPDPNATNLADENLENPAEEGQDTHFTEQQPDPADQTDPTTQDPPNAMQEFDTDTGQTG